MPSPSRSQVETNGGTEKRSLHGSPSSSTRARARTPDARVSNSANKQQQGFVDTHRSQLITAAAVAGGLALAGVIVSRLRGNKKPRDEATQGDEVIGKTAKSAPPRSAAATAKRPATRRKRSGYVGA